LPFLKIDLHVHSNRSDSQSTIQEVVSKAKEKDLDGIALTDHMRMTPLGLVSETDSFLIVPGMEVETTDGHVLVLGIRKMPKNNLSLVEVVSWARREEGVTVVAHPAVPGFTAPEEIIERAQPDAIETMNALVPFEMYNQRGRRIAERLMLPQTGGSDSHRSKTVGDAYTLVDVAHRTADDVISAIKEGRVQPAGGRSSLANRLLSILGGLSTRVSGREAV
jgi:predicted metal-dependent phosphoesterase TrpH